MKSLILLILFCLPLYPQWTTQNSAVTVDLNDVCFVDSLNGWIIGDSATILHTTDSGTNWLKQVCPFDTIQLQKIQFINDEVGYILTDKGTILKTVNSGYNWVPIPTGVNYVLEDLCFITNDLGWIVGSDLFQTRKRSVLLYTEDGGLNWVKQLEMDAPDLFSSKLIRAVKFNNSQKGWLFVGDYIDPQSITYVYQTTNGGESWEENIGSISFTLSRMSTISEDTLWGCFAGFGSTYDGGYNWMQQAINVKDIAQIDGKRGWAIYGHLSENKVLYTNDGGFIWSDFFINTGPKFKSITNIDSFYLWAVGLSGTIMKYSRNPTSIYLEDYLQSDRFELAQNYPNPFNSTTIISFTLLEDSFVKLNVYDIQGSKIYNVISKHISKGKHSVSWDGKDEYQEDLSSGIYFYELQAGNYIEIKKAILLR